MVQSPAAGRVVALGASEGKPVAAGQLVAQVDSAAAKQRLAEARAGLQRVQRQVDEVKTSPIHAKLREAHLRLQGALQSREQARARLKDFETRQPQISNLASAARDAAEKARKTQAALRAKSAALAAAQKRAKGPDDPEVLQLRADADRCYMEATAAARRLDMDRQSASRQREQLAALARLQSAVRRADKLALAYGAQLTQLRRSPEGQAALKGSSLVETAQRQAAAAEARVSSCALKARVAGRLSELRVRPGTVVKAGQTVAVIEQSGGDRLVCTVAPAELATLAVGQRAQVRPTGGSPFAAAIGQLVPGRDAALVYLLPLGRAPLPARGTAIVAELAAGPARR